MRIRFEDMFYALINAVKELDKKIQDIIADITGLKSTLKAQQQTIDILQKRIEKLEKAQ